MGAEETGGTEFIKGWDKAPNLLGEGAFGEVHLLTNQTTGEAVAMKVVDTRLSDTVVLEARKEFTIHRRLNHANIIKVYGVRKEPPLMYLFLEYAPGGELYDKIEPDIGVPPSEAQRYFRQIIDAVEYLHQLGIAHRDLKPENILIDNHDNVKISDFGMATIFMLNGCERKLEKRCGTMPYVAPEVLRGPYRAQPADLWSCGIILVALLTGELPWDEPSLTQTEYREWRDGRRFTMSPWNKIDSLSLALLQRILQHVPVRRATVSAIKHSAWLSRPLRSTALRDSWSPDVAPARGFCLGGGSATSPPDVRFACSQPVPLTRRTSGEQGSVQPRPALVGVARGQGVGPAAGNNMVSFSQPAACADDLLLGSQFHTTQASAGGGGPQTLVQKLVRRMTRFFVTTDDVVTRQRLEQLFDSLGYSWRFSGDRTVTVQTLDRRKMPLTFKANLLGMSDRLLVDFRLSKGCGLDFKRNFIRIKHKLSDILLNVPVNWSVAVATNTVP